MYDFHMHSTFSADCEVPMEEMVQAGIKQQLKKICFTEHIDYEYPDPSITFVSTWINMKMKSKK